MAKFRGSYLYFQHNRFSPFFRAIVKVLTVGTTGSGRKTVSQFETIWYRPENNAPSPYHSHPEKAVRTRLKTMAFNGNRFMNEQQLIEHIFTGLQD